jgi:hypothetical protein
MTIRSVLVQLQAIDVELLREIEALSTDEPRGFACFIGFDQCGEMRGAFEPSYGSRNPSGAGWRTVTRRPHPGRQLCDEQSSNIDLRCAHKSRTRRLIWADGRA